MTILGHLSFPNHRINICIQIYLTISKILDTLGFSFHTVTIFCVHVVSEPVLIRGHPTTLALTIALGNCRIYDKQDAVQKDLHTASGFVRFTLGLNGLLLQRHFTSAPYSLRRRTVPDLTRTGGRRT